MPAIFFIKFDGDIIQAEATEQENTYTVAEGPKAGVYPKVRQNMFGKGFFLSWGGAREAAIDLLDTLIVRAERDLELRKQKRQQLEEAAPPNQG
jgi:hypothetical protein